MSSQENKQRVQQMLNELWNGQNVNVLDKYVAKDFVSHSPKPGMPSDLRGAKQWTALQFKAFPNGEREITNQIAEGDQVVTRFSAKLPHEGDFMGIQPTNKSIHVTGIIIHRIKENKIVEEWMEMDRLGMMQQLGAIPSTD